RRAAAGPLQRGKPAVAGDDPPRRRAEDGGLTMTTTTAPAPDKARDRIDIGELFHRYGTFCIFVLLIIGAHFMSPAFLTERNIMNVLRQISGTGIMAVGMLLVILTRGIDLSVGSVSALGSVLSATLVATWSPGASTALTV